jgi:acetyl esterase/lipase
MNMKTFTIDYERPGVTLTAYLLDSSPEMAAAATRPAILVLPGGGYMFCSDREAEPIAMAYLAEGYHAFVLRYSVGEAGIFPAVLEDAENALETITSNAAEWNVDPDRVAAIGFSADGHLAACLGTLGRVRPAAIILGYPCILSSMGAALGKELPGPDEHVDASTPPAFIFQTATDPVVNAINALTFATALQKARRPYELHVFADGQHGLSLSKPLTAGGRAEMVEPRVADWLPLSVSWLKSVWGDFAADQEPVPVYPAKSAALNLPIGDLAADPAQRAILTVHLPDVDAMMAANPVMAGVSLILVAQHAPDTVSFGTLAELDEAFLALETAAE